MKSCPSKTGFFAALLCACFWLTDLQAAPRHVRPVRFDNFSVNTMISGNGFGWRYAPTAAVRLGRKTVLSAGPVFCQHDLSHTGFIAGVNYLLMSEGESYFGHCRLAATAYFENFNRVNLGPQALGIEQSAAASMHNDDGANFRGLRYSGWEASGGLKFIYRFGCGLFLNAEAMMAYYDTHQLNEPQINTYRDENAFSLKIGAGIGWTFIH